MRETMPRVQNMIAKGSLLMQRRNTLTIWVYNLSMVVHTNNYTGKKISLIGSRVQSFLQPCFILVLFFFIVFFLNIVLAFVIADCYLC